MNGVSCTRMEWQVLNCFMIRKYHHLAATCIAIMLIPWNVAYADIRGLPQVTVLADSSLTAPMTELALLYSRSRNISVTTSYESTSAHARHIQEGGLADVFIAAHPAWMGDLKQQGLIDVYSLTNLIKDRLALVIASENGLKDSSMLQKGLTNQLLFLNDRMILVMGDPQDTALGIYTKQAITKLDIDGALWETIKSKFVRAANAKNTLYLIAQGLSAGVVYYSNAKNNKEVEVLTVIDESLHESLVYQAAVVAGENMSNAREFLGFLKSEEAKHIFIKHNLIVE